MKAERATNRRNGSRANFQGRAQNLNFPPFWGRPLSSVAPIAMLQNISIYLVLATLAPQEHPKRSLLTAFVPIMSTRLQFRGKHEVNGAPQEVNIGHLGLHHVITMIIKLSKVGSKIDSGSLQCTLLATPVSLTSKVSKFVLFWFFECCEEPLRSSNASDGSPKSSNTARTCPGNPFRESSPTNILRTIKLKGLAAPGEALKNNTPATIYGFSQSAEIV